jgi:hypothetical protein
MRQLIETAGSGRRHAKPDTYCSALQVALHARLRGDAPLSDENNPDRALRRLYHDLYHDFSLTIRDRKSDDANGLRNLGLSGSWDVARRHDVGFWYRHAQP